MALFENYPYTNIHNLNLDSVVNKVEQVVQKVADVPTTEEMHLADDAVRGESMNLFADLTETKLQRYIVRLSQKGGKWVPSEYESGHDISFRYLRDKLRNPSLYCVMLYGNSKLRPQYVTDTEMLWIGVDRSTDSKILRFLMTDTRAEYGTYRLAEWTDVQNALDEAKEYTDTHPGTIPTLSGNIFFDQTAGGVTPSQVIQQSEAGGAVSLLAFMTFMEMQIPVTFTAVNGTTYAPDTGAQVCILNTIANFAGQFFLIELLGDSVTEGWTQFIRRLLTED